MIDRTWMLKRAGLLLGLAACPDSGTPKPGYEGGPCVDGACFAGLACYSDVCVTPLADTSAGTTAEPEPTTSGTTTESTGPGAATSLDTDSTSTSSVSITTATDTTDATSTTLDETTEVASSSSTTTGTESDSSSSTTTDEPPATCGDGKVDPGEQCDQGANNSDTGTCRTDCKLGVCGDGHKKAGEACDDGNNDDGDGCNEDCALPKTVQWIRTYEGSVENGTDTGQAVAVDADDNIVATGRVNSGPVSQQDSWVGKITPGGVTMWTEVFANSGPNDWGMAIDTDASGNIYAAGFESAQEQNTRMWTRKLDPDGDLVWAWKFDSPDPPNVDFLRGLVVAANGDVVVAGGVPGANGLGDVFLHRMTGAKADLWTTTFDSPNVQKTDEAYALALAPNGDLVIAGRSTSAIGLLDYVTARFDSSGQLLWVRYFDYMSKHDIAYCVTVDSKGDVVLGGTEDTVTHIVKYDAEGTLAWTKLYGGFIGGITTDAADNIYAAGDVSGAMLQVVSSAGAPLWQFNLDDPNNDYEPIDVALDSLGNVILAGQVESASDRDIFVLKYAP